MEGAGRVVGVVVVTAGVTMLSNTHITGLKNCVLTIVVEFV